MGGTDPVQVPRLTTVQREDADRVLCLAGEIGLVVVETFEAAHGCAPPAVDAIDAGGVTSIGSTGLQLLLRWSQHSAQAGTPAVLRRSSPALDLGLRVTGLAEQQRGTAHHAGDGRACPCMRSAPATPGVPRSELFSSSPPALGPGTLLRCCRRLCR